jgi:hypothetical protein
MKKNSDASKALLKYIRKNKIVTMEALKEFLDTPSRMTVFRKLKTVDYISSYSHQGKYYSLEEIARYNDWGIWCYQVVFFSQYKTLKNTIVQLIEDSDSGFTASELTAILGVKVEDTLLELVRNKALARQKLEGRYLYFSQGTHLGRKQVLTRTDRLRVIEGQQMRPEVLLNELKAALIIFYSTLDEKQRRLYGGFESMKFGRGGDERIAQLLDLNPKTVARGRKELLSQKVMVDGIRQKGGGRKQVKKKSLTSSKESKA